MAKCPGKQSYKTDTAAMEAASNLIKKGVFKQDVRIYFCKQCNAWHHSTAKVQLHDEFWKRPDLWSHKVKYWFKERGPIEQWDEGDESTPIC